MKGYSLHGLWLRHPVTRHVHLTTVCRHDRRLVDTIPYVRKLWCQFLWTFNSKYLIIIHQFFNAWKHVLYAFGPAKFKTFVWNNRRRLSNKILFKGIENWISNILHFEEHMVLVYFWSNLLWGQYFLDKILRKNLIAVRLYYVSSMTIQIITDYQWLNIILWHYNTIMKIMKFW